MKFVALENCLRVIGYPGEHDNESVKIELLSNDSSYVDNKYLDMTSFNNLEKIYCDPFKEELNNNLLEKDSREEKEVLIRYYISKFKESGYQINPEELYTDADIYERQCYRIFKNIFQCIDFASMTYSIDFWAICYDMSIDLTFYDNSFTNPFINEENLPEESEDQHNKNQLSLPTTFKEIFVETDYEKYIEPLCSMKKPLLKKNKDGSYTLIRGKGAIC